MNKLKTIPAICAESMIYSRLFSVFPAVVEAGSIKKAAIDCNVSVNKIRSDIGLLEENLYVQLFDRTSKGVVLTPDGEHIYRFVINVKNKLKLRTGCESCERQTLEIQNRENGIREE